MAAAAEGVSPLIVRVYVNSSKQTACQKYFYLFIYFPNVWYDNLPIYIVGKSIANKGKSWKIY